MSRCVTGSVSVTRSYSTATARSTTNAWTATAWSTTAATPYNGRTDHKAREKNNRKRLWHIDLRAIQLFGKEMDYLKY
jgi:hypothetical protein